MKMLVILSTLFLSISSFADESEAFQKGDCFNYTEFDNSGKIEWVVGRIDFLHLGTFDFNGTLYGKKVGEDGFATFHFELPYSKRFKFPKIACPKELPKRKKKQKY